MRGAFAVAGVCVLAAVAAACQGPPAESRAAGRSATRAHADVLFVGAHPDDEYPSLAAFGQWRERDGQSVAVATVTRGEGGGDAEGTREGAALGLAREREQRAAVAHAGIRDVYHLDRPDFWYTLSAPLTARVWDGPPRRADTLERLVRLIRATTPRTVVTMDPRPFGQHGGHQLSGRLAVQAFRLAADASAFPRQLTEEGYRPWRASRLLTQHWGFAGPAGPGCAQGRREDPVTGLPVVGVWEGAWSRARRTTWAQVERAAAREYRTQGFAALPERVAVPREELGCDWFTVLAENGVPVRAAVAEQRGLRPLYGEFRDWARAQGMPWLANGAQPRYPARPAAAVRVSARTPVLDGAAGPGEYPGGVLRLAHWEGERCRDAADCSAAVRLARHGDALYVLVEARDEARGAALDAADCTRHWRTDAVEITLDPRGVSDDTSTTLKAAVLPYTAHGRGPCAARDADHRQGPAPAIGRAAVLRADGYRVEVRIPLDALPAAADPAQLGANVLLYDSDTPDGTGQTRLAWAPFGGAQADPYAWGTWRLPGYLPPKGRPVVPPPPVLPVAAARGADSPASAAQSRRTGVPPGAGPRR
ncbi:hypothetical protein GCM10027168_36060 [Streptomyces capparidis]